MEFRLEPSVLLNSIVTALGIVLAFATFAVLRMIERYRSVQSRLRNEDIPDKLLNLWWFKALVYLEPAVYILALGYSLIIAILSVNLLTQIIGYYMVTAPQGLDEVGRQMAEYYKRQEIAASYGNLFLNHVSSLFVVVIILGVVELIPSLPWLPLTLEIAYWRLLRGFQLGLPRVDQMLRQARASIRQGDALSAILLSATAVELFLRVWLDIGPSAMWRDIVARVEEKLTVDGRAADESRGLLESLRNIRSLRNRAAHPSPDTAFTSEQAERLADDVESLLRNLRRPQSGN